MKKYQKRFKETALRMKGSIARERARFMESHAFSRRRKLPLEAMLVCMLWKQGLTTEMELRKFFKERNLAEMQLSKQGYLQQRKRLNPEVFVYLNQEYLKSFYSSQDEVERWKGHVVLSIDSSKAEIPNSRENRKVFGCCSNQYGEEGVARALISGIYDVFNGFFLDLQIRGIAVNEIDVAKDGLNQIQPILNDAKVLLLFDRGYPSLELADTLESKGYHYLFRLSSSTFKKEREAMGQKDGMVELVHTPARLQKVKEKHPERLEALQRKGTSHARIVQHTLASGTELIVMTNLPMEEYTADEIVQLYYRRWEIEKKYHTLKNKLKFESVTGKASVYVFQDFLSQIFVYNMVQDVRRSADDMAQRRGEQAGYLYPIHTNENIAIGLFKEKMIRIMLEDDDDIQTKEMTHLQQEIERYILPIRIQPGAARKKHLANKFATNQKSSF